MAKMKKAVTMADIANKLDVSIVTISKALSGQKGVINEMRGKIIELAREMGYRMPSGCVSGDETNGFRVGVLVPEGVLANYD